YHNAMALVERNAARIIEEKDLTGERLLAEIETLLADCDGLAEIGRNARAMAHTDAGAQIASIILDLAGKGVSK
ncbi:MAG: UDP-N-acetylglucosamine--N-acetylmuramyl-(pentapeptide) pyrophosphoryl-undecaprenol N-acetylglucosamine transferase, partial [Clostridia bacterium]|nr:UDP-N-acetylglucosamine--N-acetylmuramyl-(pentapeptide) pyrophosphoryl-undecaprenol N-acetylglucosamine transferase [Clostridia bacterium]